MEVNKQLHAYIEIIQTKDVVSDGIKFLLKLKKFKSVSAFTIVSPM